MYPETSALGFVIRATVTVLLVIAAWRFMLVRSLNDMFRHRLFELRRSLFLLVVRGEVVPTEPAYVQLRDTINGLLRFAERVTPIRVMMFNSTLSLNAEAYRERTEWAIAQVKDEGIRQKLQDYRERVGLEIILHLIRTSPELWPALAALVVSRMGLVAAKAWLRKHPPIRIDGIEAEAECNSDGIVLA